MMRDLCKPVANNRAKVHLIYLETALLGKHLDLIDATKQKKPIQKEELLIGY